jgi:2-polyprenyl-3-methyl-5-hydroxy-6-metoxy-1,4-benzoquinol methylase
MAAVDPDALKAYSFTLFSKLDGAVTAVMVHLGDRLGLYRALASADGPVTSSELADRTGLDERWVREWLHNQGAARLVAFDDAGERFWLTPEAVAVTADADGPWYGLGMFLRIPVMSAAVEPLIESFRSGVGYDYDTFGADVASSVEMGTGPWYRHSLVPVVLPLLDGVEDRLRAGGTAIDIGCGAGKAVLLIAEAFPAATVHGYDISALALERAEANRVAGEVTNAAFHDARVDPLPADGSADLVITFDCLHDMTHPQEMMAAIRQAIAPDGSWLLVDIKARDTFTENVSRNPMASMMYGVSIMSCMASALSEPGGAGLGTLGLPESRARAMAETAGFTRFRRLDVQHPVNAFYEVRP